MQPSIPNILPRFWASCLFAMPLWLRAQSPWFQWILATMVMLIGAWPFLEKGFTKICNRFTPIALGISVAYLYSLLALVLGDRPILYFKQLVSCVPLLLLWLLIEQHLVQKALLPIQQFLDVLPKNVSKMFPDGHFEVVPVDRLAAGDFVRLKPGETIPVDGMIFSSSAEINEAILSSENMPQKRGFGENVIGGWKNGKELCIVQVTRVGSESVCGKLQAALLDSLNVKEYSCNVFVAAVVMLAFFTFLLWTLTSDFGVAIGVVSSTFMAASATTLAFSRSLVFKRAIGIGIRHGIILNKNLVFEQIHKVDAEIGALRGLSGQLIRIMGQNFFIAVLYNAIAIPMALFGSISFVPATLAMIVASLSVAANSLRLK